MSGVGRVVRRGKPEDRVLLGDARPPPIEAYCDVCRRKVRVRKIRYDAYLGRPPETESVCDSCGHRL